MRHAPSSRLFSQPTQLLSTKQTSFTKLHLLLASQKQLVDTRAHLLESLPLCRHQVVGILFVGWTVPSHPKPALNENPLTLKCQTLCHKKPRLLNWTTECLRIPHEQSTLPHLVAPSASSSPRASSVLEVPAGVATAPAVAHHRGQLLQSSKMHFELWLLGKDLSNWGMDLSYFRRWPLYLWP